MSLYLFTCIYETEHFSTMLLVLINAMTCMSSTFLKLSPSVPGRRLHRSERVSEGLEQLHPSSRAGPEPVGPRAGDAGQSKSDIIDSFSSLIAVAVFGTTVKG